MPDVGKLLWVPSIRECYTCTIGKLIHNTPLGCPFLLLFAFVPPRAVTFSDSLRPVQHRSNGMSCIHDLFCSYWRDHICSTPPASAHFYAPQFLCLYGPYPFCNEQPLTIPAGEKSFRSSASELSQILTLLVLQNISSFRLVLVQGLVPVVSFFDLVPDRRPR